MNRSRETSALKRKRQDAGPAKSPEESQLLNLIKSKGDMGMFKGDMKRETGLQETVVNKAVNSLLAQKLIKEVVNIKNKSKKHYMAVEFEPSKELTGGTWYADGKLDKDFIKALRDACSKIITKFKVATLDRICDVIVRNKIADCTTSQIEEILGSMVLDNEIIEVKSTGLAEYASIPIGTVCFRYPTAGLGGGVGVKAGAMSSIPCGVCPRISQCTPDGIISPTTCKYFTEWLKF